MINKDKYDDNYYRSLYINPFLFKLKINRIYYKWIAHFCLIKKAGLNKGSLALDIGCGVGNLVKALRDYDIEAYGIEPSIEAKKYSTISQFCVYKKYRKLPFGKATFDLVFSNEVLEHICERDIDEFVNESYRVSKGKIIHIVCVEERGNIIYKDKTHLTLKKESWWKEKFQKLGFRVETGNKYYFFPNIFELFTGRLKLSGISKGFFYLNKKNE